MNHKYNANTNAEIKKIYFYLYFIRKNNMAKNINYSNYMSIVYLLFILMVVFLGLFIAEKLKSKKNAPVVDQYNKFANGDATNNLFIKYGGLQTIQAVVDSAVTNLLAEPTLSNVFAVVGESGHRTGAALKSALDLQFSYLFGSSFVYPGRTFTRGAIIDARNMKASHAGLGITQAQFTTFVNILVQTLLSAGVSQADVNALAPGLQSMVNDIAEVS